MTTRKEKKKKKREKQERARRKIRKQEAFTFAAAQDCCPHLCTYKKK